MAKFTRKQLVAGTLPVVAAAPLARLAWPNAAQGGESLAVHEGHDHAKLGHAAMFGDEVPAPGGPNALDALLLPPKPLPHQPGRVRDYTLTAVDRTIEVAQGV